MIAESLEKVTLDKKGCEVVKGKWYDPYTDKYFANPGDLDIDHFVPLGEGDKSANRSKGDKDPSDWLPPNKKYQCEYIKTWQKVKKQENLSMDEKEKVFIEAKSKECKLK